ncbi:MAG TPA: L,D-transpeptidase family protein [Candidatus Methylomirabilis sp.]|nr:L,D-transpeptidase family protein [Candidatus Methylomirabilis sp.]
MHAQPAFRACLPALTFAVGVLLFLGGTLRAAQAAQARKGGPSITTSLHRPQRLSEEGQRQLRTLLDSLDITEPIIASSAKYSSEAQEFYAYFLYSLPWIEEGRPTTQARQVAKELESAEAKGLRPQDYGGSLWDRRLQAFDSDPRPSEAYLVEFDVDLTVAAMRYLSDLRVGRINPESMHFALGAQRKSVDLSQFLEQELVNATDPHAAFESVEPQFLAYRRTLQALDNYLKLAARGDGEPVPDATRVIRPGDSYAGLPQLTKRLMLLGDLTGSSDQGSRMPMTYEGKLVDAIKHFQQRHGLEPDGLIDARTVKEINTPISRRIVQLQLTLERWRWLPQTFERPPIVVNIPEYRLHLIDETHHIVSSMNVVVGKAYHHETPVFESEIKAVTFRPYWYVPLKIQREELVPLIEKEAGYLSANSYEILDLHGRVVSETEPGEDILNKLKSGELLLRQQPGADNSLGLMKLEMPNRYDIYLHGTPAQELFSKSRRDFSHGCIRVEDPLTLALWVLRNKPEWTADSIRSAMNGNETIRADLDTPIPIWVVYGTAVVLEDGQVRFFEDIYGHDAALERALAESSPTPFE